MITKARKYFTLCLFLLIGTSAYSQKDTSTQVKDSLHNNFLINQSKVLRTFEVDRTKDSIKKIQLEQQISALKKNDNTKRAELESELAKTKSQDSIRFALKKQKIDSLRKFVKGYAVVPFLNDTLFSIFTQLGSFYPKDRAQAIDNRIKILAENYLFKADSLLLINNETTTDIVYGEVIVMSISDNDALWQNTTQIALAQKYKDIIAKAIIHYKKATSWISISKQIALAIFILLILITIIIFLIRLFRFTEHKIETHKAIKGIKIRNYELFDSNRQLNFYLSINTILKWILIIITFYLALPILFSVFPTTKGFADILFSYFLHPVKNIFRGLWNYLPNLFTVIVIVIVFKYVIKGIQFLKSEIEKGSLKIPGFYPDWANPTFQIIKVLLYAFMFIVIFPYLPGSKSPVFQGVSVFLGVLFTFGSSGSLSNVVAGLVLTYMRAFKVGDRVKVGDLTGDIIEKSLLVTRIRTIKNEIISVPNSNVMSSHTINYSSDASERGLILHTTVTIGYDVPWKNMHKALIDAALRTEHLLKDPKPFVLQTSLDDFYVSYQINAYTREPNLQADIYSLLHQNIQDSCFESGIEIMSSHYSSVRDGNHTTIPDDHLSKDYVAPSFRVKNTDSAKNE
ncbi:MAG TPA: mechanosensitive ion channel family protein [Bacteroidia bacterium]|nr:mechanosensitive ion channel family protein [Bacteroidia bacterium]